MEGDSLSFISGGGFGSVGELEFGDRARGLAEGGLGFVEFDAESFLMDAMVGRNISMEIIKKLLLTINHLSKLLL